jgi:hypothetical protein
LSGLIKNIKSISFSYLTYYFGAGASIHTLPMVKEIPDRIENVINLVQVFSDNFNDDEPIAKNYKTTKKQAFELFISDLRWLYENSKIHASVDTFAKKLSLNDKYQDFYRLKEILSAYLSIEQILKKPDFRYDYFFASILNKGIRDFPKNIKVVSWNYDLQFELSYELFKGNNTLSTIDESMRTMNVVSKLTNSEPRGDRFGIYKVNGSALYTENNGFWNYTFGLNLNFKFDVGTVQTILQAYSALKEFKNKVNCLLSFSWEEDFNRSNSNIIYKTINATSSTEYLVVIGYSFPFFNRDVDRQIISEMKGLKKVYFQSPTANEMIERFSSIRPDIDIKNLIPISGLSEFYLPNEIVFEY